MEEGTRQKHVYLVVGEENNGGCINIICKNCENQCGFPVSFPLGESGHYTLSEMLKFVAETDDVYCKPEDLKDVLRDSIIASWGDYDPYTDPNTIVIDLAVRDINKKLEHTCISTTPWLRRF